MTLKVRHLLVGLLSAVSVALSASADTGAPVVKIINFTADWCPNCQILNPAIENALTNFDTGDVELVNLDMTQASRRSSEAEKEQAWSEAIRLAHSHHALYLWDWYGGVTGIAAIISADTGEPITCVNRTFDEDAIQGRIQEAIILTNRRARGARKPEGPECPPPLR